MIRTALMILVLALGLGAAQNGKPKTAARNSKTGSAAAARAGQTVTAPLTIPKNAVEIEPGLWEYKDAKGKTWHYTKTPFGVRRFVPELVPDDSANEASFITAIDKGGDTVFFERKTPFGKAQWTRKRADLNDAEKLAVERTRSGR